MSQERSLARTPERSDSATRTSTRRKSESEKQQLSEGEGPSFWNSLSPLPPVKTLHAQTYNDLSLKVSPPPPSFMTPEHGRRSKQPGKSRRYVLGRDAMVLQAPLSGGGTAATPPRTNSVAKRKGVDNSQAANLAAGASGAKREVVPSRKSLRGATGGVSTAAVATLRGRGAGELLGEAQPSRAYGAHGMAQMPSRGGGHARNPEGSGGEHLQGVILGAGKHRLGGTASAEEPRQFPMGTASDRDEAKLASNARTSSYSPHDKRRRCLKFGTADYYESAPATGAVGVRSPSSSRDSSARTSESDGTLGGLLSSSCLPFMEVGAAACQEEGANKDTSPPTDDVAKQAGRTTFNVMGYTCQVAVPSAGGGVAKDSGGLMATPVGSPEPGGSPKDGGAGKKQQQQQRSKRRPRVYGAPAAETPRENGKEMTTSGVLATSGVHATSLTAGLGPRNAQGALAKQKSDAASSHAKDRMPEHQASRQQQLQSHQEQWHSHQQEEQQRLQQQQQRQQQQQQQEPRQQEKQLPQRQRDAVDSSMLACTEDSSLLTGPLCKTSQWPHEGDLSSAEMLPSADGYRDASGDLDMLSLQQQGELHEDLKMPRTAEWLAQWAEVKGGDVSCWMQALNVLSSSVGGSINEMVGADFFNEDDDARGTLQDAEWLYSTAFSPPKAKPDQALGVDAGGMRKPALQGARGQRRGDGGSPCRPDLGKNLSGLASPEVFQATSPQPQRIFAGAAVGVHDWDRNRTGSHVGLNVGLSTVHDAENGVPRSAASCFVKRVSTAVVRAPAESGERFLAPSFDSQSQFEHHVLRAHDPQQAQPAHKADARWQKQQAQAGTPPQMPVFEIDDGAHDGSMLGKRRAPPVSANQGALRGSAGGSQSTDDEMDDNVVYQTQAVPVFSGGLFFVPQDAAAVSDMFPPSSQLSFTPDQGAARSGRTAGPAGANKCNSTTTTTTTITVAVAANDPGRKDTGKKDPDLMATASSPPRKKRGTVAHKSPSDDGAWPAVGGSVSSGSSLRQRPGEGSGRLSLPSQNISYSSYANTPTMYREADEANAARRGRTGAGLMVPISPHDCVDAGFKSPSDDTIWPVLGSPGHPSQVRGRLSLLSYGSNTNDPGMGNALGSPSGRTTVAVARSLELPLMEHAKDNMASPLSDCCTDSTLQCTENLPRWLGGSAVGGGGSSRVLYSAGLSPPVPTGPPRALQPGHASLYGSKRTSDSKSPAHAYPFADPLTKGASQKEQAGSGAKGTAVKTEAAGCFVKVTNSKETLRSARASAEEPAKNAAPALAAASGGNPGRRRSSGGSSNRGCNCKKSKCLKLYCECFSAGLFCGPGCQCQGCHNTTEQAELVSQVQEQIMARDPLAFAPKVIGVQGSSPSQDESRSRTPHSIAGAHKHRRVSAEWLQEEGLQTPSSNPLARHKKGCTCKRSKCNKKYCECYQAGVLCSEACKCEGCENHGRKGCATHTPSSKNPAAGGHVGDAANGRSEDSPDPPKALLA
eukprot:jgi/Mesvir1/20754/Mv20076-RA.1